MRKVYLIECYDPYARNNWTAIDGGMTYDLEPLAEAAIAEIIASYPKDMLGHLELRFRIQLEYRP